MKLEIQTLLTVCAHCEGVSSAEASLLELFSLDDPHSFYFGLLYSKKEKPT